MFFIGIFGIENRNKEIKILDSIECRNCSNITKGKLIKNYDFFHFFFIPLFKWNETYYVVCDGCSTVYNICKDKGKDIEKGICNKITYWDLQEEKTNNYEKNDHGNMCVYCGRNVDSSFKYCPYCGGKIK